jgi:D-aminoacyl-tRNA deacylase
MRAVVQRVSRARVTVAGRVTGEIGPGLLILLGVAAGDTPAEADWLAGKIAGLRVFADADGRMNLSLRERGGDALVVSQFTLLGSVRKGSRPSFNDAASPDLARSLYERFVAQLATALGRPVATGEFAAMMSVALENDGPVTLVIDTPAKPAATA